MQFLRNTLGQHGWVLLAVPMLLSLVAACAAGPRAVGALSDQRSWEEAVRDFKATEAKGVNDGERDGRRLKQLDAKQAGILLQEYLKPTQTEGMRRKAIGALGWSRFTEAIAPLAAIAADEKESPALREAALNPGLRYMDEARAEAVGLSLMQHADKRIRRGARWVVSQHGTDQGVAALGKLLAGVSDEERTEVIYTLHYSENKKAATTVFEACPFEKLVNADQERAYALVMGRYQVLQAEANMLKLINSDDVLVRLYALMYFGNFPREDVVPSLVKFANNEQDWANELYATVKLFIASPKISDASHRQLQTIIDEGKIKLNVLIVD